MVKIRRIRGQEENVDVFTGLVEGLGRLDHIAVENGGRRLTIVWPGLSALEPLDRKSVG